MYSSCFILSSTSAYLQLKIRKKILYKHRVANCSKNTKNYKWLVSGCFTKTLPIFNYVRKIIFIIIIVPTYIIVRNTAYIIVIDGVRKRIYNLLLPLQPFNKVFTTLCFYITYFSHFLSNAVWWNKNEKKKEMTCVW